jgi:MFS family permease
VEHRAALPHQAKTHERLVIVGSTLGTLFEWYDFFLYGAVVSIFSKQFFAPLSASSAYLFALTAFGVGFAVRPLGALLDTGYSFLV